MNTAAQKAATESRSLEISLDQTARPESRPIGFRWEGNRLIQIGIDETNFYALSMLDPDTAQSLRDNFLDFASEGKYAMSTVSQSAFSINYSLSQHPTRTFDKAWVLNALALPSFRSQKGCIKSFFIYWRGRYPAAITDDALELLAKPLRQDRRPRNALSDDPEKGWLTDIEYEALLQCTWENYDNGKTGTQGTLLRLLSMQYARRPSQLASLKIGDFRDSFRDNGVQIGRQIHFPGAKDRDAEDNFRDSKEEVHPVADHLWDLYQIQRHELKALYESIFNSSLTSDDLDQLPLFASKAQVELAIDELTRHYGLDWKSNLGHRLFHINPAWITRLISWKTNAPMYFSEINAHGTMPMPPFSHRTGKPLVVTATRMRHTRARQLARLGTPKHVLSFWLGHTVHQSLDAYYSDPAEEARNINDAMGVALLPLAMSFTGKLLDDQSQASRADDPESTLEFATSEKLKEVGKCGKHSFCATTTIPIPCYRCKHFEPLVYAPHDEVLNALLKRQAEEKAMIKIGGLRKLLTPIDLSSDIRAVQACIKRCDQRKAELEAVHV